MKRFILAVATFISLMQGTAHAQDGPFGLSMGMTLEQVQRLSKLKPEKEPYVYTTTSLPNGHPQVESYTFLITPQHGLCKINALTFDIKTSIYGGELKGRFDDFRDALNSKYGRSRDYDELRAGSIWDEPRDWMMGLRKKERSLASFWDSQEGSRMPNNLASIMLEARAISSEKGFLFLSYEYKNFDACIKAANARSDSKL